MLGMGWGRIWEVWYKLVWATGVLNTDKTTLLWSAYTVLVKAMNHFHTPLLFTCCATETAVIYAPVHLIRIS